MMNEQPGMHALWVAIAVVVQTVLSALLAIYASGAISART